MQEQSATSSYAIMKRSYHGGYLKSPRESWDILSTQTALYDERWDLFDQEEIARSRTRILDQLRAIRLPRWALAVGIASIVVSVLLAWVSALGDGPWTNFLRQMGLYDGEVSPLARQLPILVLSTVGGGLSGWELWLRVRVDDLREDAAEALDITLVGRQLYLNAGTLRFAFGDAGLLVEGDRVEARHKWRDFREAIVIGGEYKTHVRLVLERDRRNEFIVVPRDKFFPGTDGVSWQTFLEMLKRHVQVVGI